MSRTTLIARSEVWVAPVTKGRFTHVAHIRVNRGYTDFGYSKYGTSAGLARDALMRWLDMWESGWRELPVTIASPTYGPYVPPTQSVTAAAAMLGRRGGLKGGPARAAKLTPEQLSEIGRKGAAGRWKR